MDPCPIWTTFLSENFQHLDCGQSQSNQCEVSCPVLSRGPCIDAVTTTTSTFLTDSFHLVQLMLNEYILHEIERLVCEHSMTELMVNMMNAQATELSDSSFIDSFGQDFLSSPNLFHGHYELQQQQAVLGATVQQLQGYSAKGEKVKQYLCM